MVVHSDTDPVGLNWDGFGPWPLEADEIAVSEPESEG